MFLRGLEGWHIVIIVALLALLFGAKRMPDAARSVGRSLRIFEAEVKAPSTADESEPARAANPATQPAAPMISNSEVSAAKLGEHVQPVPASRVGAGTANGFVSTPGELNR